MINKGITLEQIYKVDEMLYKLGIDYSAFFIIGFPTETIEDIRKTQEVIRNIHASGKTVNIFTPLPNNRLLKNKEMDDLTEGFHSMHNLTGIIPDPIFKQLVKETQDLAGLNFKEYEMVLKRRSPIN